MGEFRYLKGILPKGTGPPRRSARENYAVDAPSRKKDAAPDKGEKGVSDSSSTLDKCRQEKTDASDLVSLLTASAHCFLFSYSPQLRSLVSWSANSHDVLGTDDSELLREGNLFLRFVHPDDKFRVLSQLEASLAEKTPYAVTYRWIRPDNGEVRTLFCRASHKKDPRLWTPSHHSIGEENDENAEVGEHPARVLEIDEFLEGVIFELPHEAARTQENPFFEEAVANLPVLLFAMDRQLHLTSISAGFLSERGALLSSLVKFGDAMFHSERFAVGKPFLACFGDDGLRLHYLENLQKLLLGEIPKFRHRIGNSAPPWTVEVTPLLHGERIQGLVGIVSDASEVVRLETQLLDLRRAEGLRSLALGVSHHLNNAFQSVMGQATLIKSHPDDSGLAAKGSASIIDVVTKASELARQLFQFEDPKHAPLTPIDLDLTVMSAISSAEELMSDALQLEISFGNPPAILAKQALLQESLQNVLRLAKEYSRRFAKEQISLSVKTLSYSLREHEKKDLREGTYSAIVISEILKRPVHSLPSTDTNEFTQDISRIKSSLQKFGGEFFIERSKGGLLCFTMMFPSLKSEEQKLLSLHPSKNPQVLIVDDDQLVLDTVAAVLTDSGIACITASTCSRALTLINSYSASIQAALVDAVIPGEDSSKLIRALREKVPAIRVLGFSGASEFKTQALLNAGAIQILRKPVNPQVLKEAIHSFLGAEKAA